MRQYGTVPPVLSTAQAPAVSATSGLGTGGGAGVQSKGEPSDGQGYGDIVIQAGFNPSAGGSVTLSFPDTPPTLFIAPSDPIDFGTLTITGQGTKTVNIAWAGTLHLGRRYTIHYEWSTSL